MSIKLKKKYRSIWISDVHLGTRGCSAEHLINFLDNHDCEYLYLVGDIIDMWRLRKRIYWPQEHTNILRKVLGYSKRGTVVVYVVGNHDEYFREFLDFELSFGNIKVCDETIHESPNGKRFLVIHGDAFDGVIKYAKWLAHLGDIGYNILLFLNRYLNIIRRRLGMQYWSLSAAVKNGVKQAVNFISSYEETLAKEAHKRGLDGVICGHIHKAEIREINGILYCNDGDFVESRTALVEDFEGNLEIINWDTIIEVQKIK